MLCSVLLYLCVCLKIDCSDQKLDLFAHPAFLLAQLPNIHRKLKFLLLGNWNSFPNINRKADKKNWLFNQSRPCRESRLKRIYILWNLLSSPCWRSDTKEREWLEAALPQSYCHICLLSCPGFCWSPAPASHDRDHHWSDPHHQLDTSLSYN